LLFLLYKHISIFLLKNGIIYKNEVDFLNNCGSNGTTFVNKLDKADFTSCKKKLVLVFSILYKLFIICFFSMMLRFLLTHSIGAEAPSEIFSEKLNNHGIIVFISNYQMQIINLYKILTATLGALTLILGILLRFIFQIKIEELDFEYYR
jgi:hypothetical protein